MDPDHNLPPISTGQSSQSQRQPSQPQVQETSPFVEPEHVDKGDSPQSQSESVTEKPLLGTSEEYTPIRGRYPEFPVEPSRPPPVARNSQRDERITRGTSRRSLVRPNSSGIGWIVPEVEDKPHRHTIGYRLAPTIANAKIERDRYAAKARATGLALNIAIGMQVLLGALTTGISASLSGKQISIGISILGGLTTLVASYLARTRGSNEPELSITRVKDLDHFLRDCSAFDMDKGHEYGTPELDAQLDHLRKRFEELLGNADGQRKLSPPA
ncbi:uncharacterized protein EDB93DRAFT_101601 [Suillus bovinus]|uniref:uncharacterized protein n=1 Tax=Suillus bovinus TaxID=48563 RepID=UPI001B876671|nr:uncharacterized protein EDB93DRAFT_101601 [Suillus bovinus]KAG2155328.1 hypothetical protein EDB93DRAFT_101601 [Suillus bovinus]